MKVRCNKELKCQPVSSSTVECFVPRAIWPFLISVLKLYYTLRKTFDNQTICSLSLFGTVKRTLKKKKNDRNWLYIIAAKNKNEKWPWNINTFQWISIQTAIVNQFIYTSVWPFRKMNCYTSIPSFSNFAHPYINIILFQ